VDDIGCGRRDGTAARGSVRAVVGLLANRAGCLATWASPARKWPGHPDTLATRHEIATVLTSQGKPADAEAAWRTSSK